MHTVNMYIKTSCCAVHTKNAHTENVYKRPSTHTSFDCDILSLLQSSMRLWRRFKNLRTQQHAFGGTLPIVADERRRTLSSVRYALSRSTTNDTLKRKNSVHLLQTLLPPQPQPLKLGGPPKFYFEKGSFTINVRGHFDFQDFLTPPLPQRKCPQKNVHSAINVR